ncbi:MAG: PAS domain-containing protein [Bernardetiaceae bacterium]|nr:PAS domain-containing protein [Bernardetiaceae bacterium]
MKRAQNIFKQTVRREGIGTVYFTAVAALIASGLLLFGIYYADQVYQSSENASQARDIAHELDVLEKVFIEGKAAQRGYLISSSEEYLSDFYAAKDTLTAKLDLVEVLTIDYANEKQQKIKNLRRNIKDNFAFLEDLIELRRGGTLDTITRVLEDMQGEALTKQIQQEIEQLRQQQSEKLEMKNDMLAKSGLFFRQIQIFGTGLTVFLLLFTVYSIYIEYKRKNEAFMILEEQLEQAQIYADELQNANQNLSYAQDEIKKQKAELQEQYKEVEKNEKRLIIAEKELRQKQNAMEAQQWLETGLNHFDAIMREHYDKNVETFADIISTHIAKRLNALEVIFYQTIEDNDKKFLKPVGGYAYNPDKMPLQYNFGEGLLGQAAKSQEFLYFSDAEIEMNRIGSPLVSIRPEALTLMALVQNQRTEGVIEICLLQSLDKENQKFLMRLAKNIAVMFSNIQNNMRTQQLLAESRESQQTLSEQTEEMRQQAEEMRTTQERIQQILKEVENKEVRLRALIDNTEDIIFVINSNYEITVFNKSFEQRYQKNGQKVEANKSIWNVLPENEQPIYKNYFQLVFDTETPQRDAVSIEQGEQEIYYALHFNPVKDSHNKVIGISVFKRDITESRKSQIRTEALLAAAEEANWQIQAQEEEMRQNLEELTATQSQMQDVIQNLEKKEASLHAIIDNSSDSVIVLDTNFNVQFISKLLKDDFEAQGIDIYEGVPFDNLFEDKKLLEKYKSYYRRAFAGEHFKVQEKIDRLGQEVSNGDTFELSYMPIESNTGEIIGVASRGTIILKS